MRLGKLTRHIAPYLVAYILGLVVITGTTTTRLAVIVVLVVIGVLASIGAWQVRAKSMEEQ